MCLAACARDGRAEAPTSPTRDGKRVEKRTIVEKTPNGTRTVTITTTTTTERVAPKPPPARPADPYPADPRVRYNVELLASYRKRAGLPPLLYDAKISAFALEGSKRLAHDHVPHAHFRASGERHPAFGTRSAENQGDPNGVPALDPDPKVSGKKQIALMMKMMFDEGPGGGHHDNMMNPKYRRVGIGLHEAGGKLYLTNDFSD